MIFTSNFIITTLLSCYPFVGADIYLPSIVALAENFQTNVNIIQLSLSILMFGITFSQLFYGPLSEGLGRKKIMIYGLVIASIGCLLCILAQNLTIFLIGQFIQGIGLGSGSLFRCILRDIYSKKELIKIGSLLSILSTLVIPCAPMIGGYLQTNFNWQANFIFLFIYSMVLLFSTIIFFKETNLHTHYSNLELKHIFKMYNTALSNKSFSGYCICTLSTMFGYFAWVAVIPVLLIKNLGWTPQELGQAMLISSFAAFFLGGISNNWCIQKFKSSTVFHIGWFFMGVSTASLTITYLIFGLSSWLLIINMSIFFYGTSFLWPNYFAHAFLPFQRSSGYAGALYGSFQIGGGAIAAFVVAPLPESSPLPLAVCLFVSTILCVIYYHLIIKPFELENAEGNYA